MAAGAMGGLLGAPALAQTHAVKKPETVVRAVAVYEWTGEEEKATASRVVPVALFIDGQLQDAGVYLARPVPFAIDTGTIYETQKAGVDEGTLELAYERHLTSGDTAMIDDGWLAYGAFKAKPKETLVAKKSGPLPKVEVSGGSDRPHFGGKSSTASGAGDSGGKSSTTDASASDPDRPTLHRAPGSSSGDSTTGSSTTTNAGGATASTRTSTTSTDSDDAAERPTLKRRSAAEIKADQKKKDSAKVVGGNDLNDDPDRPNLHRGKPVTRMEEEDIPPLRGIPKDMKQMAAVSDAKDRPEHDFRRPWESDDERVDVLGKMQGFARAKLAEYKGVAAAPAEAPAVAPAPAKTTATHSTAASRAKKKAAAAVVAAPLVLTDERLEGYTLSYGGAATYFYTATSAGVGGVSRYVSVVAQEEPIEGLRLALASVTDSSHLDRTPWMRLVDVVDAEASNRASLLMELRAQHTRQFALYRVIGAQADQVFVTGSTE
jgi:hypothetical protein